MRHRAKHRRTMPALVRKAGPHRPLRCERKSSKRDLIRRALQEYFA